MIYLINDRRIMQDFLSACPDEGQKRKKVRWGLEAIHSQRDTGNIWEQRKSKLSEAASQGPVLLESRTENKVIALQVAMHEPRSMKNWEISKENQSG